MAIKKTIDIDINTNADEAAKEFDKFGKAVNTADKSVTDLNKTFEEVYGEMAPLTTRMGEAEDRLYELAAAGDTASAEYQGLLQKVGDYRKVQIQTDLAVDAAATTMGQKLGGALGGATAGFSAVQGVMGLVGGESEELEKALLKVQSALAIQQGVQGIREAIPAFKQLGTSAKKALKGIKTGIAATGVGVLLVAVGAIVAYWDEITELLGVNNQSLEEQLELEKKIEEEKAKQLQSMNQIVSNNQSFINRQIEIVKNEEKLKDLGIDSEKNKKAILAITKENINLELQNLQTRLISTEELLSTQEKITLKSEIYRKQQELLRVDEQALADQRKTNSDKKAEQDQKKIDDAKELARIQKEAIDTEIDEEIALQQTLDEIQRENEDRFRTEQENELLLVEEKYDTLQAMAQGNKEALEEIDIARLNERNDLLLKYDTEAYDAKKALDDKTAEDKKAADDKEIADNKALQDSRVQMANDAFGAISGLVTAFAGESEKSQRKAFKINKAISIAQAVINTAGAISGAINPAVGGLGIPAGIPGAALAAATGIAQVATIAKTQFGGGSTGDVSPAGALAEAQAPNFNVVGDSGVNQLATLQQQPTQAYVVSGDVTTAQALDRNRVQNATL